MLKTNTVRGSIPEIIRNDEKLYEGNLVWYFQALCNNAQNLSLPYHNLRHPLHVLWLCYDACKYYGKQISPKKKRWLLIASLVHDADHSGLYGHDDLNIERAKRWLEKFAAPCDRPFVLEILSIMRATEYPHHKLEGSAAFLGGILRDADVSQALSPVWIQQVVLGLAAEWRKSPLEILKMQEAFLGGLEFHSEWAKATFPRSIIEEKISEARELVALFEAKH